LAIRVYSLYNPSVVRCLSLFIKEHWHEKNFEVHYFYGLGVGCFYCGLQSAICAAADKDARSGSQPYANGDACADCLAN
jgi:hypothetical protein